MTGDLPQSAPQCMHFKGSNYLWANLITKSIDFLVREAKVEVFSLRSNDSDYKFY